MSGQVKAARWQVGEDIEATAGDASVHRPAPRPAGAEANVGCVLARGRCRRALIPAGRPFTLVPRTEMRGPQHALLQAGALSERSSAAAKRALRSAEEAREVAVATLGELATQTETLKSVAASLEEAEDIASASEERLDKINTRCLGCFGPKRLLQKRRGGRGHPSSPTPPQPQTSLGGSLKSFLLRQKLPSSAPAAPAPPPRPPPLFGDAKLAGEAAEQDETLARLDETVGALGVLSRRIGDELERQAPALETVSGQAEDLSYRFRDMNRTGRMGKINRRKSE